MNNAQYLVAQIGKRSKRRYAVSLPLEPSEIPNGDWQTYDEKRWRSGRFSGKSDLNRRAVKTGSYNVLRTYSQQGASKAVLVEIRQMANGSDAADEVQLARLHLKISSGRSASALSEAELVETPSAPANTSATCFEQFARRGDLSNTYRYAVDSVDHVVFLTAYVTVDEGPEWEEVIHLSSLQADRIRRKLAGEGS